VEKHRDNKKKQGEMGQEEKLYKKVLKIMLSKYLTKKKYPI
jgi:hypothetical protein